MMEIDSSSEDASFTILNAVGSAATTNISHNISSRNDTDAGASCVSNQGGERNSISGLPQSKLKRSSSAPVLIGGGVAPPSLASITWGLPAMTSVNSSGRALSPCFVSQPFPSAFHSALSFRDGLRARTMSLTGACSGNLGSAVAVGPQSPLVPRVHQIRAEEMEAVSVREAQQERELTSKLAISQYWDEFCIDEGPHIAGAGSGAGGTSQSSPSSPAGTASTRRLHSPIFLNSTSGCSSPSSNATSCPTASGLSPSASRPPPCFSPSLALRTAAAAASMRAPSSPSPTRGVQRHRSQSPQLVLRPSALGAAVKRKLSSDSDGSSGGCGPMSAVAECGLEKAKRLLTLEDAAAIAHSSSSGAGSNFNSSSIGSRSSAVRESTVSSESGGSAGNLFLQMTSAGIAKNQGLS